MTGQRIVHRYIVDTEASIDELRGALERYVPHHVFYINRNESMSLEAAFGIEFRRRFLRKLGLFIVNAFAVYGFAWTTWHIIVWLHG